MLSLIFSRATKRRMVGLLALGEWGPATGAITGSVSTAQAKQETLAGGTVLEPVQTGVGGGGGPWIYPWPRHPPGRSWFDPRPQNKIPARGAISGSVTTQQARQQSLAVGTVVTPVEIPVITVPRGTLDALVRSSKPRQDYRITVIGKMSDDEREMLTALLLAAD